MPAIPSRVPVGDPFPGMLSLLGGRFVLSASPLLGADIVAQGIVLRYGARLLEKPFVSIVPGLIALERGEMMTGDAAWDFLLRRSNLYPRAEVYGFRDDGKDDMLTVKRLDLAIAPKVLAYTDASATVPLAEVVALIGEAAAFPARAAEYLPPVENAQAFLATLQA
ncbi:MAG: hypothetical protein IPK52_11320 [Chloroflexi bacterium]|nr:hypothetical protein [Chloroflexota bacterium]